jgi:cell wall-associated NlpC family hydrolase
MTIERTPDLEVLHRGARSEAARALQAAVNRRLRHRHLGAYVIEQDGVVGPATLAAVKTAAWALGALRATLQRIDRGEIPIGVQRMIRNPGLRTDEQKQRGKRRIAHMLAERGKRDSADAAAGSPRRRVVELAQRAAANYRRNPGAYHYLAGGIANVVCMQPTPRAWRSDCSQFAAAIYKAADLPSPADVDHQWASTYSIVRKGRLTTSPRPGDLGMYGSRRAPHHVEIYCGAPGQEFIGHGSPPIDSLTPGRPDFYLTYDFLG